MLEYLDQLLSHLSPMMAYFILFLSAIIENIFPPIPGDTVTVLGAYLTSTGKLDFWGVYLSTTAGSVAGFFMMYLAGIKFGRSFINSRFRAKVFSESQLNKVQIWFSKYGYMVIAGNRFLSGTRSVISLFAGFFHLNWVKVLLLSTVSALIWNGLLIYGGYLLGVNWQSITGIISEYNYVVISLTLVFIAFIIYRRFRKKRLKSKLTCED
jgi:membrane protein DedA with SNARE-associated domain